MEALDSAVTQLMPAVASTPMPTGLHWSARCVASVLAQQRSLDACLRERRPDLFDPEAYTPLAGYEAIGVELGDIRLDE